MFTTKGEGLDEGTSSDSQTSLDQNKVQTKMDKYFNNVQAQ